MKGQWGKLAGYFLGTLLVSAAVTFGLPRLGGGSWLPDLISSEGQGVDNLFWGLLILSLVIFAIVAALVLYSMVHFRVEPGDMTDGAHIHGNAKMEAVWIIVPTIIVFIVGVFSYMVLDDNELGLYDKSEAKTKGASTMSVDVRGYSFGWAFRYNKKDEVSSELVLPVDEIVRFNVLSCSGKEHLGRLQTQTYRELDAAGHENEFTEIEPGICEKEWDQTTKEQQEAIEEQTAELYKIQQRREAGKPITPEQQDLVDQQPQLKGDSQFIDVNHAFWVPEARLKIDAVSGLRSYVQWQPDKLTGPDENYQVVCAELCGSGHNGMRTDMCVVDKDTFTWWLALDAEGRKLATCTNLRALSCLDEQRLRTDAARDEAVATIAKYTKEHPNADCNDVTEKAS